jgi:hypothetical protein
MPVMLINAGDETGGGAADGNDQATFGALFRMP